MRQVRSLQFWFTVAGAVTTTATLLTLLSPFWWVFALLEHVRLQYCLILLIVLLVGLISRRPWKRKGWQGLWLFPLLINLWFLSPILAGSPGTVPAAQSSNSLRVLHLTLDHENPEVEQAIGVIQQFKPDLLSLLEVTHESLPYLKAGLPDYQQVIAEPRNNSHGSAWFVRRTPTHPIQITETAEIHLPPENVRPLLRIALIYAGQAIQLLCFHATRPRTAATAHYQQVEFNALAEWSRKQIQTGEYRLVVIGDFNSTPWSQSFRQLLRDSGLQNSQVGFGLHPTWHASLPSFLRIPIDLCLPDRSLVTVGYIVGDSIGSDHLPIAVDLRL